MNNQLKILSVILGLSIILTSPVMAGKPSASSPFGSFTSYNESDPQNIFSQNGNGILVSPNGYTAGTAMLYQTVTSSTAYDMEFYATKMSNLENEFWAGFNYVITVDGVTKCTVLYSTSLPGGCKVQFTSGSHVLGFGLNTYSAGWPITHTRTFALSGTSKTASTLPVVTPTPAPTPGLYDLRGNVYGKNATTTATKLYGSSNAIVTIEADRMTLISYLNDTTGLYSFTGIDGTKSWNMTVKAPGYLGRTTLLPVNTAGNLHLDVTLIESKPVIAYLVTPINWAKDTATRNLTDRQVSSMQCFESGGDLYVEPSWITNATTNCVNFYPSGGFKNIINEYINYVKNIV